MALTPPAPQPVPAFAKGLIHWAEDTFIDPYREFYDYVSAVGVPTELEWRYAVLVFSRASPTGTTEDNAQIGFNIMNVSAGNLDTSWTTTDYQECEAAFIEWLNSMASYWATNHVVKELRWYVRAFNDKLPIGQNVSIEDPTTGKPYKRFANSGPAVRIVPIGNPGANATPVLPYQVALSVTFRTPTPRHWGRVYLPGLCEAETDLYGRFTAATISPIANYTAELVDDLAQKDFQLVVPTTQADSKFHVALSQVTQVQVDDVPDVIRRRRPRTTLDRQIGSPIP